MENETRSEAITKALEDWKNSSDKPTLQVTLKGQKTLVPVITLDPQVLVLNHDNFRIASQIQDSNTSKSIHDDPTSDAAQAEIENHLSRTKEYPDLVSQLKEYGQQEPGLISSSGLLINGNTRAVALRKLRIGGMQVGILPDSANNRDLLLVQASLQMRKWVHQDYTFTNELLFLEDLRSNVKLDLRSIVRELSMKPGKRSEDAIATKFRLLELIREVRSLTAKHVPYSFFDDKRESLQDLDKVYQKEKNIDLQAAEQIKQVRLLGIVRGLTKDQVRAIGKEFAQKQAEQLVSKGDGDGTIFGGPSLTSVLKGSLEKRFDDEGNSVIPTDEKEKSESKALQVEAENAINEKRLRTMLEGPNDMLEDAITKLEKTCLEVVEHLEADDFDRQGFSDNLRKLKKVVEKLESIESKHD